MMPSFYKDEKYEKFKRQWGIRLGLESIKMKHAIIDIMTADKKGARKEMKEEISDYIGTSYENEMEEEWKDLYITNHTPKDKRYHTNSKKEDLEFYKYKMAVEEYNKEVEPAKVKSKKVF
jgi:hypothetical protein